jgi:quercetin dioxygenase-like cupin family protein
MQLAPRYSNIIYRKFTVKKGEVTQGHTHNFHHDMLVVIGKLEVIGQDTVPILNKNGDEIGRAPVGNPHPPRIIEPGSLPLSIPKDTLHWITALKDSEYFCLFAARNADGEVVDENNGNMDAAQ